MRFEKIKYLIIAICFFLFPIFTGCIFESVNQPASANPGEIINISLTITDNFIPEPNPHRGVLGIIVPSDWEFISATYTSVLGNGVLIVSPAWKDSIEFYYPPNQFSANMKWIGLISDQGYAYTNITSFYVQIKLKVGQTAGCFNIGYLTTKATSGLLGGNPAWAPLSYPHPIGIPNSNMCNTIYETRRAVEWDNLFDRNSGWTGADGIYSIPLNSYEAPSNSPADSQLILFSDTFIGEVDNNNRRRNASLVNNTLAILRSNIPDSNDIQFFWRTGPSNTPRTVFVPNTPNANAGDWYWLMDGISLNDIIYVFALRLNSASGVFGFEVNGVALLKFKIDSLNFISDVQQFDTPLFLKNEIENWDIVLGQAIMPMTDVSGNPSPDGYIYVYGPISHTSGRKELVAARVIPEEIENFGQWQYWNGTGWDSQIENIAPITQGISQEFSVSPIDGNKYLLVYQMGSSIAVRTGTSPIGPFGIFSLIYDCPEVLIDPDIFVYNAKAHPNLSDEEELLISYNVNTFDFWDHFANADIYRPRFIYLKINNSTSSAIEDIVNLPSSFSLSQNYPNPFNPSTTITFAVSTETNVSIKIFNIMGEMISELINNKYNPGYHEVIYNVPDGLSSGVYFYRIEAGEFVQTKKMVLMK